MHLSWIVISISNVYGLQQDEQAHGYPPYESPRPRSSVFDLFGFLILFLTPLLAFLTESHFLLKSKAYSQFDTNKCAAVCPIAVKTSDSEALSESVQVEQTQTQRLIKLN